ncbi:MAG TPA: hypothetical protein VN830_09300 [Verrucomicrobiae bacterium]|nr:hypothetical protein [Verrucomicrobiae bacterium]
MDTDDRFARLAHGVKARIAEFQTQLVFALRAKTPVAFMAGRKSRVFAQLASVYFGMYFQRAHENSSQTADGTLGAMARRLPGLNLKDLKQWPTVTVGDFAHAAPSFSWKDPWSIERIPCDIELTCPAI